MHSDVDKKVDILIRFTQPFQANIAKFLNKKRRKDNYKILSSKYVNSTTCYLKTTEKDTFVVLVY